MRKQVDLFWWRINNSTPNLGDELGPIVLNRAFGLKVNRKSLTECEAISVGSILGWPVVREVLDSRNKPLHVLGSGFMHGKRTDIAKEGLVYHFVRGALTYSKLFPDGNASVDWGDLGLLVGEVCSPPRRKLYRYAYIPHHSKVESEQCHALLLSHPDTKIIDLRTDDIDKVCEDICSAEVVISQSLHGLVMADSLGVPNVWLWDTKERLHAGGAFKFYDYFSSIGRPAGLYISSLFENELDIKIESNVFELSSQYLSVAKASIYKGMDAFLL